MSFTKIELPSHIKGDLYLGDNLEIMKSLPSNSIDLIYGDPPFYSNRNYSAESKIDKGEIREFTDTFKTLNDYLKFLYVRLIEMKRLLKPTGTIYIHLDWHAVHYVKVMMDKIYGYDNFINHIIWCYSGGGCGLRKFAAKHDDILSYAITDKYVFNMDDVRVEYSDAVKNSGHLGSAVQITKYGKEYTYNINEKGKRPEDWWDIPFLTAVCTERVEYPTQKPEALLERIIKASSNEDDTVADFFAGSGTTAAVCQRLNRKWITCDKSEKSIEVIKTRLLGNKSVKDNGYQIDVENAWS